MDRLYFACEEGGGVAAAATGAFGFADIEDLVHTGVEGGGLEGITQLVDDGEEDLVDVGVEGTVAAAIEIVIVWPNVCGGIFDPGRLIELGVDL
jgi:hypothetical protein